VAAPTALKIAQPAPVPAPVAQGVPHKAADARTARPAEQWSIVNETPRPIWLECDSRVLALAPLEQRLWSAAPGTAQPADIRVAFPALRRLEDRRQVVLCPKPPPATLDAQIVAALRQMRRWSWYNFTMAMVVAVGILIPAVALYLATDLHEVVTFWPDRFAVDTGRPLLLIGRLMQLTFISVATLMPALMYFQFDAERLGTLRHRWIHNVFRLDPTVFTLSDVKAKYERQLEEAYGMDDGRGRLTRGRRSPIIVTTLILAFGWLLILLRAGDRITDGTGGSLSFLELLNPDQSLVTFAFLGAYFFGLHLVWQGYVRTDLRPKTYTTIAVRILVVVVLAWLIEAITTTADNPQPWYLLAFVAGFVPDKVLHLLWEKVLSTVPDAVFDDRQQPLTRIEGIDLYERTRLSEEGITSVEALAHHDLLDLFFKTRFPAARLVDWVDQAILEMYLHGDDADQSNTRLRAALRTIGVRTASDLVLLTQRDKGEVCKVYQDRAKDLTEALSDRLPEYEYADVERRLHVLCGTLDHSEWLGRIENWRRTDLIEANADKRRYIDEHGELCVGDPRLKQPRVPAKHARGPQTRFAPHGTEAHGGSSSACTCR